MTHVAGGVRNGVTGPLSLSDLAVVAARARGERLDVIDEAIVAPRRRLVTAFAIIRRFGMRIEQRCRAGRGHAVVAAEAGGRRVLESRVDVARRTLNGDVRAGQREAGRIVIEFRCRGVLRLRAAGDEQNRCRNKRQHHAQRSEPRHPHRYEATPHDLSALRRLKREFKNGCPHSNSLTRLRAFFPPSTDNGKPAPMRQPASHPAFLNRCVGKLYGLQTFTPSGWLRISASSRKSPPPPQKMLSRSSSFAHKN